MYTRDTENECLSRFVRNSEEIEQIGRLKKVDTDVSLDYILIRSARTHELYIDNAAICSQWIRPILEEIEQCPPHIIQSLAEFAQALCEKEHCLDREAGFHVHQALLRYARQKGDRDFLIRELYHCGIGYSEYMTDKLAGVFGEECKKSYHNAYFFEGAKYLELWREISDSKTMDLIIRCFLNRSGGYTERDSLELQHTLCQEALTVVNRADLRAAFPDLPWDGYALVVHMNVTAILNFARDGKCSQGIIRDIVRSARLVMQGIHRNQLSASRWQFVYYAARYHNGGISLPIFLEKIHELYVSRNQSDFSKSGIWANIKLPFIYLDYLVKCRKLLSAEEQEKNGRLYGADRACDY